MIKVEKLSDGFVVSEDGVWIEGAYETETAARLAAKADPGKLADLWRQRQPINLTKADVRTIL